MSKFYIWGLEKVTQERKGFMHITCILIIHIDKS